MVPFFMRICSITNQSPPTSIDLAPTFHRSPELFTHLPGMLQYIGFVYCRDAAVLHDHFSLADDCGHVTGIDTEDEMAQKVVRRYLGR